MFTLNCDRAHLYAHPERELTPEEQSRYDETLTQRSKGVPAQYITGHQEFWGLDLIVSPAVLIPRPETEHLIETVLPLARAIPHPIIADVGTGSGAIAIALASVLEHASLTAIDISPAALAVAADNAGRLGLAGRIRFLHGDLLTPLLTPHGAPDPLFTGDPLNPLVAGSDPFDPLTARANPAFDIPTFDVVASNPPYVALGDGTLAPEVRDHEPPLALYAGTDGLDIYRRLIPQALEFLRPGGLLALEIGYGQRDALSELLADWHSVRFLDDYAGIPRVALAIRR
jgi:release factor glutamine methyltransferase